MVLPFCLNHPKFYLTRIQYSVSIFTLRCIEFGLSKYHNSVVVFYRLPNIFPEENCKHNLETSIISSATFAAVFLGIILVF